MIYEQFMDKNSRKPLVLKESPKELLWTKTEPSTPTEITGVKVICIQGDINELA